MKKNILFVLLIIASVAISLNSCQKDFDPGIDLGNGPKLGTTDKAKLSAALKVWHGTRTVGTPPAPNAQSPAIDPTANPSIRAIAGRLAIIKPEVTSGTVAGYYIGVPGAGQYFKLDFSKPRDIIGRPGLPRKRNNIFSRGTEDSSIVIVLPANINAPDTFCVTYCPYDSLGNIGQPVTTCIYVAAFGATGSNAWLFNDFKFTASWEDSAGVRLYLDTIIFNRWVPNSVYGYQSWYCDNGNLALGPLPPGAINLGNDSVLYTKNNLRFALNGAFDYQDKLSQKDVNVPSSSCTQLNFTTQNFDDILTGGFSYDDATKKLILVYELDDTGIPVVEYYEGTVTKINDNHFILRDIDGYYVRFQR